MIRRATRPMTLTDKGAGMIRGHPMQFETPVTGTRFEIPDEWWSFADMDSFTLQGGRFYPYHQIMGAPGGDVEVVRLAEVEPPLRNEGVPPFKKYKLLQVLFAFQSPEGALPPVEVFLASSGRYRFKVRNGYHRYYASVAVGFAQLPIVVCQPPYDFGYGETP